MKIACYTDIHNQQCMLNMPTRLRRSATLAIDLTLSEFGKADLAIIGGDNVSDYPYYNHSCALPYANWLDIKQKIVDNFSRVAKDEKVLYINGNNDLILGDLPTKDNPPYNTCEFYESGPMKETLGILPEEECYAIYAKSKGKQAGLYHLAFHYMIDGIDFFGLNIDPDTAFDSHEGTYNKKALVWLKEKLDAIDPDGNKVIFVVGHLSATTRRNGKLFESMRQPQRDELYHALSGHRNLFYLYGHVHGQGFVYQDSRDGVIAIDSDGKPMDTESGDRDKISFHVVHMGGLRPFTGSVPFQYFEEDGLTGLIPGKSEPAFYEATGTPKLAQYLLIETTDTSVSFSYRNTGSLEGYSIEDKPKGYTVSLR